MTKSILTVVASAAISIGVFPAAAFAQATTTPAMPSCAAGDPVVWENSSSKAYHMQGDKYYGKTKHGAYACKSAADSAGYHAAGSKKHASTMKGMASPAPAMGAPSPAAT